MTSIEQAVDLVRETCDRIGPAEFARLSGVPYTTIRDWRSRDFRGPGTDILAKLLDAAQQSRVANDGHDAADGSGAGEAEACPG